jgi:hypothetical protein
MDKEKLKLIVKNLESLIECLKTEVYSDTESYLECDKTEVYSDTESYLEYDKIVQYITDYDEVFCDNEEHLD